MIQTVFYKHSYRHDKKIDSYSLIDKFILNTGLEENLLTKGYQRNIVCNNNLVIV